MLQKLTGYQKKPVWINIDMIVKMETIGVQDDYPATQLSMIVGGIVNVFESPEEIAALTNLESNELVKKPAMTASRPPSHFYESSNGDVWSLVYDANSGRPSVMHQPNAGSGGKASYIDVDHFLRESPGGPQHLALKRLMTGAAIDAGAV